MFGLVPVAAVQVDIPSLDFFLVAVESHDSEIHFSMG